MSYSVRITRVNESEHKNPEETFNDVTSVDVGDDGRVVIKMEGGRQASMSAWGSVHVVRVAGR